MMRSRSLLPGARSLAVALLLFTMAGCTRQDTEALARIGRKLTALARSNGEEISTRLDLRWTARKELGLQEKIQERLRWENTLADQILEVCVKDQDVELKGSVNTALQRQRAIELAETVAGVAKVTPTIQVRETADAGK